jgi:hypothetical protein
MGSSISDANRLLRLGAAGGEGAKPMTREALAEIESSQAKAFADFADLGRPSQQGRLTGRWPSDLLHILIVRQLVEFSKNASLASWRAFDRMSLTFSKSPGGSRAVRWR